MLPVTEMHIGTGRVVFTTVTKAPKPPDHKQLSEKILQQIKNVNVNVTRNIPLLRTCTARPGKAIVVGAGNSWKPEDLPTDGTIFAVGRRAALKLNRAGILPHEMIIASSETHWPLPGANRYLFSSLCDPVLFQMYAPIEMFHSIINGYGFYKPEGTEGLSLGGGYTAGLTSLVLAYAIGYREIHLYGYDASGRYQTTPGEKLKPHGEHRVLTDLEGVKYTTNFWLLQQAVKIAGVAQELLEMGCKVFVHGTGLLPSVVAKMYEDDEVSPANEAIYDCCRNSPSYDFVKWLVASELYRRRKGAPEPLKVRFTNMSDDHPFDAKPSFLRWQMLHHVMRPLLKLVGAVEDDTIENVRQLSTAYNYLVEAHNAGEEMPRIKVPNDEPRSDKLITVTLREAEYLPVRNSNIPAWQSWARKRMAEGYEVVFIRDTAKADVHFDGFKTAPEASTNIEERLKLYQKAFCNLSISTGPIDLLLFTDNPMVWLCTAVRPIDGYRPHIKEWWHMTAGINFGDSFPFLKPNQRMVWSLDSEEEIEAAWQGWLAQTDNKVLAAA